MEKVAIFYDGACHLCSKEVAHYRKEDKDKRLRLVDISQPDFDAASEGLDPKAVNKYFHVKNKNGEILTGVGAFATIWEELNIFRPLAWMAKNPVTRFFMDAGYKVFAEIRPFLPKKKDCDSGNCQI
tara:strand:+ start:553 stop:933 length:381 start_codon:yes stop_codon:yes gene_type:complete